MKKVASTKLSSVSVHFFSTLQRQSEKNPISMDLFVYSDKNTFIIEHSMISIIVGVVADAVPCALSKQERKAG